ncbi:MAG: DUF327 family protein [Firmicutes bacterium]|nr:DUF327 family protein [Bacillota bacterium]
MKINGINKQAFWPKKNKVESKGEKSFNNQLDLANREHSKEQLRKMLKKINHVGNMLKVQASESSVADYKQLITEYLAYVLKNFYTLRKSRSLDYSTLYTRIEIIDKEVEQLTEHLLENEKEALDIVATLDKINGLLLDIYQ